MTRSYLGSWSALAVLATSIAGCSDVSNVNGEARLSVTLQRVSAGTAAAVIAAPTLSFADASSFPIDPNNVLSLTVQVTSIEFLPVLEEGATEDDAAWIALELGGPIELDLMALPTVSESPLVIAAGDVAIGSYRQVRLFLTDATITFDQAFIVGQSVFEGEHPVTIPSSANTGLKTDLTFTVADNGAGNPEEVSLLFDPSATFQNVTATGNGNVMLSPVLRARPGDAA